MSRPSSSPSASQTRLGDLLWRRGACDRNAIRRALALQTRYGDRLGTNLLASGWISEKDLALALGEQLGVHAAYGDLIDIRPEVLALVDEAIAAKHLVVPHHIEDETLFVLMVQPHDPAALEALRSLSQKEISPVVVCEARMWKLLQTHYDIRSSTRSIVPLDTPGLDATASSMRHDDEAPVSVGRDALPNAAIPAQPAGEPDSASSSPTLEEDRDDASSAQSPQAIYDQLFQDFPDEFKSERHVGDNDTSAQGQTRTGEESQREVVSIGGQTRLSGERVTTPDAPAPVKTTPPRPEAGPSLSDARGGVPKRRMHAMVKKFQSQEHAAETPATHLAKEPAPAPRESDDELKALYQKLLQPDAPSTQTKDNPGTMPAPSPSAPGHSDEKPASRPPAQGSSPALQGNYRKELGRRLQENTPKTSAPVNTSARTSSASVGADAALLVSVPPPSPAEPATSPAGEAEDNSPEPSTMPAANSPSSPNEETAPSPHSMTPVQHADFAQKVFQQTPTRFRRLALLSVHADQITGWDADGDLPLQRVRNFCVARDTNSVFQWVAESQTPYIGPLQATPANELWLDASGGQRPKSVVVLPIRVDGVVAHLLYGDNGEDKHVSSDIGELSALAQRISDAYGLMMELARKSPDAGS